MNIEILGTPFNGLPDHTSIENPPDGLRQAGVVQALEKRGHILTDLGDLEGFQSQQIRDEKTGITDFELWLDLTHALSQRVSSMLDRGSFPLILGGDCRLLVGAMKALIQQKPNSGLVFIDGHADFHTAGTSPTGDPADMELAVLTGRGPHRLTHVAGRYPILKESDVVVYGIRAWDHIDESSIKVYDRNLLTKIGVRCAVEEGLRHFAEGKQPVWLHFDVDVLDPDVVPVMFPEPGGLSFEETRELIQQVWNLCAVEGLSVACYHPRLDTDGIAGKRLVTLISDVLPSSSS